MKKGLISSYIEGITNRKQGESYTSIMRYFWPECITALLLYSVPILLEAYFIGYLKSSLMFGTLSATNTLTQWMTKVAEALSVGTIILSGRFNGCNDFPGVGRTLRDAFWVTGILGLAIASFLYIGAPWIYSWYVPQELVPLGVPFLRLKAIYIFLMFVVFAFFGFLRGIKNTRVPMAIYAIGNGLLCLLDYIFIFGHCGSPAMGLQGAALASVIQWAVMLLIVIGYVMYNPKYRKYSISLFSLFNDKGQWKHLLNISWPVLIDKSVITMSYMWLLTMLKPLGAQGVATFGIIQSMERLALIPAVAFAQIITFLVSNDFGAGRWDGIKNNIKKLLLLSGVFVSVLILILTIYSRSFIQCFDRSHEFTELAAWIFPMMSVFILADVLQLVLSGAVRGAGSVRVVMWTRLLAMIFLLMPLSYVFSKVSIQSIGMKFLLIYGTFYLFCIVMSIVYIRFFRGQQWQDVEK